VAKGSCSVDGCEVSRFCKGLCKKHYRRLGLYGDPMGRPPPRQWPTCTECHRIVRNVSRGMCSNCYNRWAYWRDPDRARDKSNRRPSSRTNAERAAARRPVAKAIRELTEQLGRRPLRHELPELEQERLRVRDRAAYHADRTRRVQRTLMRSRANAAEARRRATAWRIANPEKARAGSATKKARKRAAPGVLTGAAWLAILDVHPRCYYCGATGRLDQEHMTPLSRGGHHSPINVVPACSPCNLRKRTLTAWEFVNSEASAA
jgi:5-methylcytosine-specific restriction endonuclease McrA